MVLNWSLFFLDLKKILATIWTNQKKIKIQSTRGQTSLVVSKSIILYLLDAVNFLMSFWSFFYPNPVPMVLKFWKIKYLVLIKEGGPSYKMILRVTLVNVHSFRGRSQTTLPKRGR